MSWHVYILVWWLHHVMLVHLCSSWFQQSTLQHGAQPKIWTFFVATYLFPARCPCIQPKLVFPRMHACWVQPPRPWMSGSHGTHAPLKQWNTGHMCATTKGLGYNYWLWAKPWKPAGMENMTHTYVLKLPTCGKTHCTGNHLLRNGSERATKGFFLWKQSSDFASEIATWLRQVCATRRPKRFKTKVPLANYFRLTKWAS